MELEQKHYPVIVHHPDAGDITLHARNSTANEQIKYKHTSAKILQYLQGKTKDKLQDIIKKLLQQKNGIGYGMVVGLDAPVATKSGGFKNGFTLGGKPVFCNPDTGECYPDNWKNILLEKVPNIFDAVADRQCSNVYASSGKDFDDDDLDEDDSIDDETGGGAGEDAEKK